MRHVQWTHNHQGHVTRCTFIDTGDWRSSHFLLETGEHRTTVVREPTQDDYRKHLREAGIDPRGLTIPTQMQRPQTTDARQCGSCRKFFPRAQLVRPKRGNLICTGCAEKKGIAA